MGLKNVLLLSTFVLSSSCAQLEKIGITSRDNVQNKTENQTSSKNISKAKKLVLEAQKKAENFDDPSQIVGSSNISTPYHYDGKTYFLYGAEHLNLENYYFDIPVVYNAAVKKWINFFLKRGRGFFERYSARAGRYAPVLSTILEKNGLPKDLIFLAMAESGFHTKAKSWAKAVGPWQFMPYTGKRFGLKIDWYVDERRDPIKATGAASRYLKKLHSDFQSWELAAAAYNAGEGKVGRAIKRYRTENFWKLRRGRYLKPETKNYVPKIMALAIIGKNLKSFGFEDIDFHEPLEFEEVKVAGGIDLYKVANALNVDFEEIQRLNPEVLRWFTPPNVSEYTLRIPVGYSSKWASCCSNRNFVAEDFQRYKIRGSRSTLKDVARKFKIKKKHVLSWLNSDQKYNRRLKRGTYVTLPFRNGQSKRENMYADLYEKPRRSVVRRRKYKRRIRVAKARARAIRNPSRYYTVQKGDSLWSVARKTGTSLDTLIVSNLKIIKRRMIRAGDRLVVK